jgi:hypothetical protein
MALDAAKMAAMRGDDTGGGDAAPPSVDPDAAEDAAGGEPSPEELEAAGRAISAIKLGDRRAFCAAIKDLNGE